MENPNLPVKRSTKFNALDLYAETKVISEETIRKTLNKISIQLLDLELFWGQIEEEYLKCFLN